MNVSYWHSPSGLSFLGIETMLLSLLSVRNNYFYATKLILWTEKIRHPLVSLLCK